MGEFDTLTYYGSVNNLAENIADFDIDSSYIHHIKEDINFYLDNFLLECKKENIIGIITTENIHFDIQQIFKSYDTISTIHELNNNQMSKIITDIGYEKLKKYLYRDYDCIDKLNNQMFNTTTI